MAEKFVSKDFTDTRQLAKLKAKALRSGVWFKALQRIDRALLDLTIRVASMIRNVKLVKSIRSIANKLERAMGTRISKASEEIGVPLAQKLSTIALKLGNVMARSWATDFGFARFLAVMHINDPEMVGLWFIS
jgi:hypothetical protein